MKSIFSIFFLLAFYLSGPSASAQSDYPAAANEVCRDTYHRDDGDLNNTARCIRVKGPNGGPSDFNVKARTFCPYDAGYVRDDAELDNSARCIRIKGPNGGPSDFNVKARTLCPYDAGYIRDDGELNNTARCINVEHRNLRDFYVYPNTKCPEERFTRSDILENEAYCVRNEINNWFPVKAGEECVGVAQRTPKDVSRPGQCLR